MNKLLPKELYKFVNIKDAEIRNSKQFYFYCDNLQEGMHLLFWLEEYNSEMHLINRGYCGISNYISMYEINGEKYTIIISSFYHNGELPKKVRQIIYKIDKPDVVIYSVEAERIICGIENTETGFVGNASWQRHGRIMNFLSNEIPFVFFAYYSKVDQSSTEHSLRKPSPLFVLSFFSLSLEFSTPAIISLYEHEDINQCLLNKDETHPIDTRKESLTYILSLITNGNDDTTKEKLKKCFKNMKEYYNENTERVKNKELPITTLKLLRDNNFEQEITNKVNEKDKDFKIFKESDLFEWAPVTKKEFKVGNELVGIKEYLNLKLNNIDFYDIAHKSPAGIVFNTKKLIKSLNQVTERRDYYWEDTLNEDLPTLVILLKLTKKGKMSLPDPYNGRIPAFYELYQQSFGKLNCISMLIDHSNDNEYDPDNAKGQKIFKSINDYSTILVDRDFNVFNKNSDNVSKDIKSKYQEGITEDNVTCFFETILKAENIKPSFINPPCGSWSDIKLYPTKKFLYMKKEEKRPDIAYYIPSTNEADKFLGTYFVGESKCNYESFRMLDSYNIEVKRINDMISKFKSEIKLNIDYKSFILFYGSETQGRNLQKEVQQTSERLKINYIAIIEESIEMDEEIIKLIILEV